MSLTPPTNHVPLVSHTSVAEAELVKHDVNLDHHEHFFTSHYFILGSHCPQEKNMK